MTDVPSNLIPTRISQLPEYTGSSQEGYLPYVYEGVTYKVRFSGVASAGEVPPSRTLTAGTGLTGGGDLSADRVFAISDGGVGADQLDATGVVAGVYGDASNIPTITVDANGRVSDVTTSPIVALGYVPESRVITAGDGLSGGGNLADDRSFSVNFSSVAPSPLGSASAGVANVAAREDHVHPAVDLSDMTETQGTLPLGRGGTGASLSPIAGAVAYSNGTHMSLTPVGVVGQVLVSGGVNAPSWVTLTGTGTVTSVNIDGATSGLNFIGGPITTAGVFTLQDPGFIQFDTAYGAARNTGRLWWNDDDNAKTFMVGGEGSDVDIKLGEQNYFRIKASAAITKGQVVMFTGTVGASGGLQGAPATGLTKATASYIMGVAAEDIALNGWGYITEFGLIRQLDTTAFSDGDILYYDPDVVGGLRVGAPPAPAAKAELAAVVLSASNGSIFVRATHQFELEQLNDVETAAASNLDLLEYNGGSGVWRHRDPQLINVGGATNVLGGAANQIVYQTGSDSSSFIAAPTSANTFLEWSGSAFQWSANPLGTVTSVDVSGGTTGLTASGGPVTSSGTITLGGTLAVANGGTGATDAATALTNLGAYPASNPDGYTTNTGTVTSVAATAGTGISVSGSPITTSGTLTITNTAPDQTVTLTQGGTTTITGTYPNFTISSADQYDGTVTSVAATVPTGFAVSGSPITTSGTLAIGFDTGYSLPTDAEQANWDTAYTDRYKWDGGSSGLVAATGRTSLGLGTSAVLDAGVAGGVATLDGGGTVPTSQLPSAVIGAVSYQGTWNASTNTPTLTSSTGTQGYYYVVSVAGTTTLDGISDWGVGDWAIFNGSTWDKIDNTDAVTSVNGYTGTVVLDYSDVGAYADTNPAGYTTNTGTVTSVAATAGTGISVSGSPITTSGTLTITNTAPDQTVTLTQAGTTTITGTYPNFTISSADQYDGTVTSVSGTGTVNGLTLSGTVTSSGSLTLGGTLSGIDLTSQITGTLPVANGGTGATSLTSGYVLKGNGTSPVSASVIYDNGTNVGIGTSSPVNTNGGLDASGALIARGGIAAHQTSAGAFDFSTDELRIRSYGATAGSGRITFRTGGGGGSADAERARITSAGRLGVNSNAPATIIHASDPTNVASSTTITRGSNHSGLTVTTPNNGDNMVGIFFATGPTTAGSHWSGITGNRSASASHWGTHLSFYTHGDDFSAIDNADERLRIDGSGNVIAYNNFRAPIFYDYNNTAYYVDPASRSQLSNITVTTGGTEAGIRFRGDALDFVGRYSNYVSLYNQLGGELKIFDSGYLNSSVYGVFAGSLQAPIFYDSDNTGYYVDPNSTSNLWTLNAFNTGTSINISGHIQTNAGGVKWNENGVRSWNMYPSGGGLLIASGDQAGSFNILESGGTRSRIFYDYDNTAYYVDPASGSNLAGIVGFAGGSYVASNGDFVARRSSGSTGVYYFVDANDKYLYWDGSAYYFGGSYTTNSLIFTATQDMRSPIYYDSNNTGYYVDPASSGSAIVVNGYMLGGLGAQTTGGTLDWNNVNNARSGSTQTLLRGSATNGMGGGDYYHPLNFEYSSKDGSGNVTQMAIAYGLPGNRLWMRGRYSGSWSSWVEFLSTSADFQTKSGHLQSNSSLRAPIFYDSDNTNYYVDPSSSSVLNSIYTDTVNSVAVGDPLELCYVRGNEVRIGPSGGNLPIKAATYYDYADTNYYLDPNSGSKLFDLNIEGTGNKYLYIYSTSGNEAMVRYIGGSSSSWYVGKRTAAQLVGTADFHFFSEAAGATVAGIDTAGNIFANSSVRAPIFYDYNNTGYYVDPAGTSFTNIMLAGGGLATYDSAGNDPYGKLSVTRNTDANYAYLGFTRVGQMVYQMGIDTSNRFWIGGGTAGYNGVRSDTYLSFSTNGDVTAKGDFRAPIFYDSNNTGYYINPNETSVTWRMGANYFQSNDDVSFDTPFGLYFANTLSSAYAIFRESGGWTHPYPDLRIAFHTGIKIGANAGYGGVKFYTDYDMATQVMSVNNGSDGLGAGNVYVNNSLQAGSSLRAPVFYDSNNTAYYVDPAGNSAIRNICLGGGSTSSFDATIHIIGAQGGYDRLTQMSPSSANKNGFNIMSARNASNVDLWWSWGVDTSNRWRINQGVGFSTNGIILDDVGNLTVAQNVTAYSDARLKKDVETIDGALELVSKMRGVRYTRIDTENRNVGVIAQEILEVLPEVVQQGVGDDDTLSVAYGNIVGVLIEAIKELKAEVETLKKG